MIFVGINLALLFFNESHITAWVKAGKEITINKKWVYPSKQKPQIWSEAFGVIPLGLEPRTHTLKVYCSTN